MASDTLLTGLAGWQLLDYYRRAGRPVVVLDGDQLGSDWTGDPGIVMLSRRCDRSELLKAVRTIMVTA